MVSVICVYNNKAQFEKQLLHSLLIQNCEYELLAIDNCEMRIKSAAAALNSAAAVSKGDILIFSHQDIQFKSAFELKKMVDTIKAEEDGTIVGTQGAVEGNKKNISNLTDGKVYDDKYYWNLTTVKNVSCIDEGLFGMKKVTWENHNFDEKLCPGWDLYAVEMCLNARKQGFKVVVAPIQIHHFSRGKISIDYMQCLRDIGRKYSHDFKYIWTTCYKVPSNQFILWMLYTLWCFNRMITGRALDASGSKKKQD